MHGAIKPGALKPLDREGLLQLAARCVRRVEPWRPPEAEAVWTEAVARLLAPPQNCDALARQLADHGARAANDQSRNYAALTLIEALKATVLHDRKALVKAVIGVAKYHASLFNQRAHAGLGAPFEVTSTTVWAAVASDVEHLARGITDAPLWPDGEPAWAKPSSGRGKICRE